MPLDAETLASLVQGNTVLAQHPDVVAGLANAGASQGDAQTVDSFLQALSAERSVNAARLGGTTISISPQDRGLLDGLGVNYKDVVAPPPGTPAGASVPAPGPVTGQAPAPKAHPHGIGGFLSDLANHIVMAPVDAGKQIVGTTFHYAGLSLNVMASGAGDFLQQNLVDPIHQVGQAFDNVAHGRIGFNVANELAGAPDPQRIQQQQLSEQRNAQMTALGMNPKNPFAQFSFLGHGYAHEDLTPIINDAGTSAVANKFGWDNATAVNQALLATEDPEKFSQTLIDRIGLTPAQNDALNSNQPIPDLTAAQEAALKSFELLVPSKDGTKDSDWETLLKRVAAKKADVGNVLANGLHLKPGTMPYNYTAATANVIGSFIYDPFGAALNKAADVRRAAVGIASATDAEGIRSAMAVPRVHQNFQSLLDDAAQVREGLGLGTPEGIASANAAMAHARVATPDIAPLIPAINGKARFVDASLKIGEGAPITSMNELTDYMASGGGLLHLVTGSAATRGMFMPGATTMFGFRAARGAAAARSTEKATMVNFANEKTLLDLRPDLDPANAVDSTGALRSPDLAGTAEPGITPTGPASAQRGLSTAEKGTMQFNLRKSGTVDGDAGPLAAISPQAVAQRAKLSVTRLTNLLARNGTLDVDGDPAASLQQVFKIARTYLNKADATTYMAKWANSTEGDRAALIAGLRDQIFHAAGTNLTEGGQALRAEWAQLDKEVYSHASDYGFTDSAGNLMQRALWPSQGAVKFTIPAMSEIARNSAKIGLWQNTVGRVVNSPFVDSLMANVKMGQLLRPAGAPRNNIEAMLNVMAQGKMVEFLKARAALDSVGTREPRKAAIQAVVDKVGLDHVGQLYRKVMLRNMSDYQKAVLQEAVDSGAFHAQMLGYAEAQAKLVDDPHGVATFASADGLVTHKTRLVGYGAQDVMEQAGAQRYAYAMAQRFNQDPDLVKAVLESIENRTMDLSGIKDALRLPTIAERNAKLDVANKYVDSNGVTQTVTNDAERGAALDYQARHIQADALHLLTDQNGNYLKSVSDYIMEHGRAPHSDWISENLANEARPAFVNAPIVRAVPTTPGASGFLQTLANGSGKVYKWMVEDPIKRATSQPVYWMHYIEHREFMRGAEENMAAALAAPTLARLHEAHAGELENRVKSPAGETEEEMAARQAAEISQVQSSTARAAATHMDNQAARKSYVSVESMIDDPASKMQSDIVGRNFFLYSRASQAFARRWASVLVWHPENIRKLMLISEGMHQAGVLTVDANGTVHFTYPGSGLMMDAVSGVTALMGHGSFQWHGDLQGQFNMLAPGFDNPAHIGGSPVINLPLDIVKGLFPSHRIAFDQINEAINGGNSATKKWYSDFVPNALQKFTALSDDQVVGSAVTSTIANMKAAGLTPPDTASKAERDLFFKRVTTQVKNEMFLRAVFGEFAPAPPGLPNNQTSASEAVDGLYSKMGITNLADEYKVILNETGGDPGLAKLIFLQNHPDRLIYAEPRTVSATNKAYLPATKQADEWMESNLGFLQGKYGSVAAYFTPQGTGDFDLSAYNAQIEQGMRVRQTPQAIYEATVLKQDQAEYYSVRDVRDSQVASALAAGDSKKASLINAAFAGWAKTYTSTHPLFDESQASYSDRAATARDALRTMTDMLGDDSSKLPANVRALKPKVQELIDVYNMQQSFEANNGASSANPAPLALRKAEKTVYDDQMKQLAEKDPNLTNIYNGIFRALDSSLSVANDIQDGGG